MVFTIAIAVVAMKNSGEASRFWSFVYTSAVVFASLGLLINFIALFTTPITVDASDIYGEYEIDRNMFPGKNADWQYETYRMEVTDSNVLKLYQLKGGKVIVIYETPVLLLDHYNNTRLKLEPGNKPRHHMLRENPLMVREPWSFYYVFHSPYYGNMYFRKKGWWLF